MSQYVIVDLEMCRVSRNRRTANYPWADETIQIGAVLLGEGYELLDEFNTYVSPDYGCVDHFITNLTGIERKYLKNAPSMDSALTKFVEWIPADAVVVSWSNTDLRQIQREVESKHIVNERFSHIFDTWMDCQRTYSEKINENRPYRLTDALAAADIIQEGHEHDGLVDAYNTARLFAKMMLEPDFKVKEYKENMRTVYVDDIYVTSNNPFCNIKIA